MRRRTTNPAEDGARRLFRQAGFRVEAVPFIRAQHDGEFMRLVIWPAKDTADVIEFLTRPENRTLEVTRVHVGYPGPTGDIAVRIYLRFDIPRAPLSAAENAAEWARIERALEGTATS